MKRCFTKNTFKSSLTTCNGLHEKKKFTHLYSALILHTVLSNYRHTHETSGTIWNSYWQTGSEKTHRTIDNTYHAIMASWKPCVYLWATGFDRKTASKRCPSGYNSTIQFNTTEFYLTLLACSKHIIFIILLTFFGWSLFDILATCKLFNHLKHTCNVKIFMSFQSQSLYENNRN